MPRKWTAENIQAEALKYSTRGAFQKRSNSAYNAAKDLGIRDLVCAHMQRQHVAWTPEAAAEAALQYTNRKAFQVGSNCAYQYAKRNGLLDGICKHMPAPVQPWTLEGLCLEAKKYETRKAFARGSYGAYLVAGKRGLLDRICRHMKRSPLGFDPRRAGVLYYLRITSLTAGTLYKIGITNYDVETRFRPEDLRKIEVLKTWRFENGADAHKEEQRILKAHKAHRYTGEPVLISYGNTELFTHDILGLDVYAVAAE